MRCEFPDFSRFHRRRDSARVAALWRALREAERRLQRRGGFFALMFLAPIYRGVGSKLYLDLLPPELLKYVCDVVRADLQRC